MAKEDYFTKHMQTKQRIHDEIIDKEVRKLNEKLKSDKYTVDSIVADSTLGIKYHDLINSKDKMNSKLQRNLNQTYHQIDIELSKVNKKVDQKSRMINYRIENKKEDVLRNLKYNVLKI